MMALFSKSAVEKARERVAALEATVARWQAESAARLAERSDLESRVGDEVLADETAVSRLSADIARLGSEASVAMKTAEAAGRQLDVAQRDVLRALAAELRDRAAKLTQSAADRQRKTDRLLAELKAFEGATYVPFERQQGVEYRGDVPDGRTPTTALLRFAAVDLERQAAELEQIAKSGDTVAVVTRLSWPESSYEPETIEREFAGVR